MMTPLADGFPTAVVVGGAGYDVNTDFRTALNIMEAWEDPGLTWLDKQDVTLALLYGDNIPPDPVEAFDMARFFLDCGEEPKPKEEDSEDLGRLYSFTYDGKYIYSAIHMTHGIDLDAVKYMHWWKFCYLLQDLSEDCYFQRMIYLRAQKARGKLTKEEKEEWRRNEAILLLPENRDPEAEAANADFMAKYQAAKERRAKQ